MVSAQLFLKVIGKDIGKFSRFASKHGLIDLGMTKGCVTFDYIKGFSPKNGHFHILSFKDAEGRLMDRTISFMDSGNFIGEHYRYEPMFGLRGRSVTSNICQGKRWKYIETNIFDCGEQLKIEEVIKSSRFDKQNIRVGIYSVAEKPKEVSWAISKRNPVPEKFNINGIKEKIENQDAEYLPILLGPIKGYTKKAEYLAEVNKKKFGLRGIVPKIQTESVYLMTKDFSAMGLTNPFSGKIKIGYASEKDLVDCVGHEFQHAKDFSDMYRLESNAINYLNNPTMQKDLENVFPGSRRFINKSINSGIIKDSNSTEYLNIIGDEINDYENLCNKLGHDNLLCEKRAISAGKDEVQRYTRARSWVKRNLGIDFI